MECTFILKTVTYPETSVSLPSTSGCAGNCTCVERQSGVVGRGPDLIDVWADRGGAQSFFLPPQESALLSSRPTISGFCFCLPFSALEKGGDEYMGEGATVILF